MKNFSWRIMIVGIILIMLLTFLFFRVFTNARYQKLIYDDAIIINNNITHIFEEERTYEVSVLNSFYYPEINDVDDIDTTLPINSSDKNALKINFDKLDGYLQVLIRNYNFLDFIKIYFESGEIYSKYVSNKISYEDEEINSRYLKLVKRENKSLVYVDNEVFKSIYYYPIYSKNNKLIAIISFGVNFESLNKNLYKCSEKFKGYYYEIANAEGEIIFSTLDNKIDFHNFETENLISEDDYSGFQTSCRTLVDSEKVSPISEFYFKEYFILEITFIFICIVALVIIGVKSHKVVLMWSVIFLIFIFVICGLHYCIVNRQLKMAEKNSAIMYINFYNIYADIQVKESIEAMRAICKSILVINNDDIINVNMEKNKNGWLKSIDEFVIQQIGVRRYIFIDKQELIEGKGENLRKFVDFEKLRDATLKMKKNEVKIIYREKDFYVVAATVFNDGVLYSIVYPSSYNNYVERIDMNALNKDLDVRIDIDRNIVECREHNYIRDISKEVARGEDNYVLDNLHIGDNMYSIILYKNAFSNSYDVSVFLYSNAPTHKNIIIFITIINSILAVVVILIRYINEVKGESMLVRQKTDVEYDKIDELLKEVDSDIINIENKTSGQIDDNNDYYDY